MKWPCGDQIRTGNVSVVILRTHLLTCLSTERQRNGTARPALILKSSARLTFSQKSKLRKSRFTASVAIRFLLRNSRVNLRVTNRPSSVSDANEKASSSACWNSKMYRLDVLLPQCGLSNIGAFLLPHIGHNTLCTIPSFESLSHDRDVWWIWVRMHCRFPLVPA